jgi:hypothetical protein
MRCAPSDTRYYNGSTWHDEYDQALGRPLGDAVRTTSTTNRSGTVYTRKFEHASVHVDVPAYEASIDWSN